MGKAEMFKERYGSVIADVVGSNRPATPAESAPPRSALSPYLLSSL